MIKSTEHIIQPISIPSAGNGTKPNVASSTVINRIFVEVDRMNDYNKDIIEAQMDGCVDITIGYGNDATKDFFTRVICDARFEENLFLYIKEADEIYMSTSIIPIVGGTDMGSPELWHGMMKKAIEHKLTGKKIFNLNQYKSIMWDNLDKKLLKAAFKENELYVVNDDYNKWLRVDINEIGKSKRW